MSAGTASGIGTVAGPCAWLQPITPKHSKNFLYKALGTANAGIGNLLFTKIAHINIRLCRFFLCSARRVDVVKGRKLCTICLVDGLMDVRDLAVAGDGDFGIQLLQFGIIL